MSKRTPSPTRVSRALSRRTFLQSVGALGLGVLGAPSRASGCADTLSPLNEADANGLRLPTGFTSRVIATTGDPVGSSRHVWHSRPDGGATFPTPEGGWIYVSNSEVSAGNGGVGAIVFAPDGSIVDAYSILTGTSRNCGGGPTPWNTWLSAEEVSLGEIFECDPASPASQGVARPALGWFKHEAAAIDPIGGRVYLTEDEGDGLLYRFTPTRYPDLGSGALEAAEILDPMAMGPIGPGETRPLAWHAVPFPNPGAGQVDTRDQVPTATRFDGGEGIWYRGGLLAFSTKGDNRIWTVDVASDEISILYDLATSPDPELSGVDNVFVAPCGDVLVAEDGGNLEIVALTVGGDVKPIVRLEGVTGSEITGPAYDPSTTRLYFSSQRNPGVTYEVSGPFEPVYISMMQVAWSSVFAGAFAIAATWAERRR